MSKGAFALKDYIIPFCVLIFSQLSGPVNRALMALFVIMVVDYITGIIAAVRAKSPKTEDGKLSSKVGMIGLLKKCVIMLMVIVAYQLELISGVHNVREMVIIGFVCNESLSIMENAIYIGVPVPEILKNVVSGLTDKNKYGGVKND